MRFSLTRHQRDNGVVTLTPVGEVDMGAVDALGCALQDTLSTPDRVDVVVDLARVTFLDCAGIGALVTGRNTAVSRRCGYTVVKPQRQVRRVLELTGVLTALTGRPQPAPVTVPATRSRRSGRHRDDRRVAAGPPAPSTADVFASHTNRSW
jgi:anti-anti-sigma factor